MIRKLVFWDLTAWFGFVSNITSNSCFSEINFIVWDNFLVLFCCFINLRALTIILKRVPLFSFFDLKYFDILSNAAWSSSRNEFAYWSNTCCLLKLSRIFLITLWLVWHKLLMSAPATIRASRQSVLPFRAAMCRGGRPSLSAWSMLASALIRALRHLGWPFLAACSYYHLYMIVEIYAFLVQYLVTYILLFQIHWFQK